MARDVGTVPASPRNGNALGASDQNEAMGGAVPYTLEKKEIDCAGLGDW